MVTPGQCLKDSATLSLSLVIDRYQTHDDLPVPATDVGHQLATVPCLGTVNTALLGHDGDHRTDLQHNFCDDIGKRGHARTR